MASKTGDYEFMSTDGRQLLLKELHQMGELNSIDDNVLRMKEKEKKGSDGLASAESTSIDNSAVVPATNDTSKVTTTSATAASITEAHSALHSSSVMAAEINSSSSLSSSRPVQDASQAELSGSSMMKDLSSNSIPQNRTDVSDNDNKTISIANPSSKINNQESDSAISNVPTSTSTATTNGSTSLATTTRKLNSLSDTIAPPSQSESSGEKNVSTSTTASEATATKTTTTTSPSSQSENSKFGTGCLACGDDDDHANLLLCEGCNAEYHTYCLDPPLRSVPAGDWYCPQCVKSSTVWTEEDDGLERMICALSPTFTERFGEVCWAYGGSGFGWWPSIIYDPRAVVGGARELAKKNIGKRHLVYFFECHDAPFAVLTSSKLTDWEKGLVDNYHLGKAAKSSGKNRSELFAQALQAASLEYAKPIELRMDWNHTELPQVLPSPKKRLKKKQTIRKRSRKEMDGDDSVSTDDSAADDGGGRKKSKKGKKDKKHKKKRKKVVTRGFPLFGDNSNRQVDSPQYPSSTNLAARNLIQNIDGDLYLTILRKPTLPSEVLPTDLGRSDVGDSTHQGVETSTTENTNEATSIDTTAAVVDSASTVPTKVTSDSSKTMNSVAPAPGNAPAPVVPSDVATATTSKATSTTPTTERIPTSQTVRNIGFIKLPSRNSSTFADAREVIVKELVPDVLSATAVWRFFVPGLGPMTISQEKNMGPMLQFLRQTTTDQHLGNGSPLNPLKVFLVDMDIIVPP